MGQLLLIALPAMVCFLFFEIGLHPLGLMCWALLPFVIWASTRDVVAYNNVWYFIFCALQFSYLRALMLAFGSVCIGLELIHTVLVRLNNGPCAQVSLRVYQCCASYLKSNHPIFFFFFSNVITHLKLIFWDTLQKVLNVSNHKDMYMTKARVLRK